MLQQTYANWELGSAPRPAAGGVSGASRFRSTISSLADFLGVPVLDVLRMAYLPDLALPESDLVAAYRQRITELEESLAALKVQGD